MTKNFKLPKNVRSAEELGFDLTFKETKIRGSEDVICEVFVLEEGSNGFEVSQTYSFNSWFEMLEIYPTMMDFLTELSQNQHWDSSWLNPPYNRIYFIQSSVGHEGLYDMKKTVWLDAQEVFA